MRQMLLKVATTGVNTDHGTFEAVISTSTIDRERDVVEPAAMVAALRKWVPLGKKIPLAWNHSTAAQDQIGHIDPASAQTVNGEVVVKGWIDQSTDVGKEAWRLVKSGTLGFSFGYLVLQGSERKGGGQHITGLDVFEVSATPTPMNADTRVVGWKAAGDAQPVEGDQPPTASQLRILNSMIGQAQEYIAAEQDAEDAVEMAEILETLEELRGEPDTEDEGDMGDMPMVGKTFPRSERAGAREGLLKAVWTAAYINSLPDSSFLHVESGGTKDDEGKTVPRSLRHFPVKDAGGTVDMPHLRNALARIPQSNLSQAVKDRCVTEAQRMMNADTSKTADAAGKEHASVRSVDPLRSKADALILDVVSDGESRRKPSRKKEAPQPQPEYTLDELRELTREYTLIALTGDIENP